MTTTLTRRQLYAIGWAVSRARALSNPGTDENGLKLLAHLAEAEEAYAVLLAQLEPAPTTYQAKRDSSS